MAKTYDQDAIEMCRSLYCKYGGRNHDAIELEMRKVYPGWQKANLHDRGGTKSPRMGWITRYGFERSLELHIQGLTTKVHGDEQDLYIGIKNVRKTLQAKVETGEATKDEFYQYRDFCKLEIDARKNLDLSRDNLETFVAGYEKLLDWSVEIDPKLAALLVKYSDKFAEKAEIHYGKAEVNDGAVDRENESGGGPDPDKGKQ